MTYEQKQEAIKALEIDEVRADLKEMGWLD